MTALDALAAEIGQFSNVLEGVTDADFEIATPAEGWTIRHQVAHLVSVYKLAETAARQPEGFRQVVANLSADFTANVAAAMAPLLALDVPSLRRAWVKGSQSCLDAFETVDPDVILPWLVSDIPAKVLCLAGVTEAFAHGQDVLDALGEDREPADHVRAICEFAYHTRRFGYAARGLEAPQFDLRFELRGPRGQHWVIGPDDCANVVTGSAWDLALLVTRRRHPDDLDLVASNDFTRDWMNLAQAYRGPAGKDRPALGTR